MSLSALFGLQIVQKNLFPCIAENLKKAKVVGEPKLIFFKATESLRLKDVTVGSKCP